MAAAEDAADEADEDTVSSAAEAPTAAAAEEDEVDIRAEMEKVLGDEMLGLAVLRPYDVAAEAKAVIAQSRAHVHGHGDLAPPRTPLIHPPS